MKKGRVILVGAGPSDAGLLTVKGQEALKKADVVVYDKLVGIEILNQIPVTARRINVGKRGGHHPVPQEAINQILLQEAEQGNFVVRLKGGDPFLFGRGGEELELLQKHKIPFEVIPGITSAISVPCYAGIPVTHRDYCSSLHIITGHTKSQDKPEMDYEALVRLKGTLVFLMGVGAIHEISQGLINAGMARQTPAAMIENGTTARQRTVVSTIEQIGEKVRAHAIKPPAVLVVGEVCGLQERFSWIEKRPLNGKRIVVTRPRELCSAFSEKIRALGGEAIEFPCIITRGFHHSQLVQKIINKLREYQWILFTSAAGVETFFSLLKAMDKDSRILYQIKIAVIGKGTKEAFEKRGILVDLMPSRYDGSALAEAVANEVKENERVLLLRAKEGTEAFHRIFYKRGISFDDIPVYETVYETEHCSFAEEVIRSGDYDYAAFTSASTVKGFAGSLPDLDFTSVKALCIGEQTAMEAGKYGMKTIVANAATMDGMIDTLMEAGEEK